MIKPVTDLYASFKNEKGGFSARKLSSFALMICVYWLHYKYANPENAIDLLIADLCAIMLLLGIVTAENIIQLKNGNNKTDNGNP